MVKTKNKSTLHKAESRKQVKPLAKSSRAATRTPRAIAATQEVDTVYLLKLVLYLIIGSQWLRITRGTMTIPIPVGMVVGFIFARNESFQIDRKLEYAILLMAMFIGFWVLPGIELIF